MQVSFRTLLYILLAGLTILVAGRYFYFQPRFVQGEKVPDFQAVLQSGEAFSLSQLRGNYVLLDFWGSWCGPCRAQNPGWVEVYRRYSGQSFRDARGFAIVSIGVERDPENWAGAIAADGLYWPYHVLDQSPSLRFFSGPIAKKFQIRQLPTCFLINPEGKIIGVDPTPEGVADILASKVSERK